MIFLKGYMEAIFLLGETPGPMVYVKVVAVTCIQCAARTNQEVYLEALWIKKQTKGLRNYPP